MKKYAMGIDPGKSGCIVVLDEHGKIAGKFKMPTIGKSFNLRAIKDIIKSYPLSHVVVEDVPIIFGIGKSSMCDIFKGVGILMGLLEGLEVPFTMVVPKAWQGEMWVGIKKVMKNTSRKRKDGSYVQKVLTKETSLLAAQRLFPKTDFTLTEQRFYSDTSENRKLGRVGQPIMSGASTPHDGFVDALLMAEYCRRKFI